jgi:hypothetical protein
VCPAIGPPSVFSAVRLKASALIPRPGADRSRRAAHSDRHQVQTATSAAENDRVVPALLLEVKSRAAAPVPMRMLAMHLLIDAWGGAMGCVYRTVL